MKSGKYLLAGLFSGAVVGVVAYGVIGGEQFLLPVIVGAVAALVVPVQLLMDDHFFEVKESFEVVVEPDRQQVTQGVLRFVSLIGVTLAVCYVFQLPMHVEGAPLRRLQVLWSPWLWTFCGVLAVDAGVQAVLKKFGGWPRQS